jgi:hypothetical protein
MKSSNFIIYVALLFLLSMGLDTAYATEINYSQARLFYQAQLGCTEKTVTYDFYQTNRKQVQAELFNPSASNDLHITICSYELTPYQNVRKVAYVDQELKPGQAIVRDFTLRKNSRVYIEMDSSDIEKLPPTVKGTQGYAWLYEKQ